MERGGAEGGRGGLFCCPRGNVVLCFYEGDVAIFMCMDGEKVFYRQTDMFFAETLYYARSCLGFLSCFFREART